MEAGIWVSVWSFVKFLPFFFALLLLGIIKGALFGPWAWLAMTIGISALILGLWPMHVIWTYYCIIRTKMVGPVVKLLLLRPCLGLLCFTNCDLASIFASQTRQLHELSFAKKR